MKRHIIIILAFIFGAINTFAEVMTDSRGVQWTYTLQTGNYEWENTATITGVANATGDVEIPSYITVTTYGHYDDNWCWVEGTTQYYYVMDLAYGLFANCNSMTSLKVPNGGMMSLSIYSVANAVAGCTSLREFKMDSESWSSYQVKNGAIYSSSSLELVPPAMTDVKIAAGTYSISYGALQYCTQLKSLTIPRSLEYINNIYSLYSSPWGLTIYYEEGDGLRVKALFGDDAERYVFKHVERYVLTGYAFAYQLQDADSFEWDADDNVTHDGVASLRNPKIADSQKTSFSFVVTNATSVSWWWKCSSELYCDYLHCYVDGVHYTDSRGCSDWSRVVVSLDGGTHTIKIEYAKDGSASSGEDCGWVDGLLVKREVDDSADVICDFTPEFEDDGTYAWAMDSANPCQGRNSLRSAKIGNYGSTYVSFNIAEVATLSWWWKVSSELGFDYLSYYVDGELGGKISGSEDWAKVDVSLGAGLHEIKYVYSKDGSSYSGQDCGWVGGWTTQAAVWKYADNDDGTVSLTGLSIPAGRLSIPEVIEGRRVTGLCDWIFECCNNITGVVISNGVSSIGMGAFEGCKSFATVTIPPSVSRIGERAFNGTALVDSAPVGPVIVDGCVVGMKTPCPSIIELTSDVRLIADGVFDGCGGITSVFVDAGDVTRIRGLLAAAGAPVNSNVVREKPVAAFDVNGGSSALPSLPCVPGRAYGPLPFPVREGYVFDGWYSEDGTMAISTSIVPDVSSISLVAHWKPLELLCAENADGTLTVTGCVQALRGNIVIPSSVDGKRVVAIGPRAFCNAYYSTEKRDPDFGDVAFIVSEGVTNIQESAFRCCNQGRITSISLPSTMKSIAEYAFYDCSEIATVSIPDMESWLSIRFADEWANPLRGGARLLVGETEATDVQIPVETSQIGDYAFVGCLSLGSLIIPDGVESIGTSAFRGCANLTNISISQYVRSVGSQALDGTGYWQLQANGPVVVGRYFLGWSGVCPSRVEIPEGVETICSRAMQSASLTEIVFPSSLKQIDDGAFAYCTGLTVVVFPDGLEEIGSRAFYACRNIAGIGFPDTLKLIGDEAFKLTISSSDYFKLSDISIRATGLVIGKQAFYNYGSVGTQRSASISLLGSGIEVGDYAFSGFTHGNGVTLDLTGVSKIGNYAFQNAGYDSAYRYSDDGLYDIGSVVLKITDELMEASTNAFSWAAVGKVMVPDWNAVYCRPGWLNFLCQRTSAGSPWEGFYCKLYVADKVVDTLVIPDGTESIPSFAFYGLRLKHVEIPETVTSIGDRAFGCSRATVQFRCAPPSCDGSPCYGCSSGGYSSCDAEWLSVIENSTWCGLMMSRGDVLDYPAALGVTNLVLTNVGGASEWFVQDSETHDGDRAMRSNPGVRGGVPFECEIEGPADVSFWWKIQAKSWGYRKNTLCLQIDNGNSLYISNRTDWERVSTNLTAGIHKLTWYYYGVEDLHNYGDYGLLDELEITYDVTFDLGTLGTHVGGGALLQRAIHGCSVAAPDVKAKSGYVFVGWDHDTNCVTRPTSFCAQYRQLTIADALDNTTVAFVNDGDSPWVADADVAYGGCASLRSGKILKNKSTAFTATINGKGILSFWWRASSEVDPDDGSPCDFGAFLVDGIQKVIIAGETEWQRYEVELGDGNHILQWLYKKDKSTDCGEDCVWVDCVTWTPTGPSLADDPDAVVTGDAESGYTIAPSEGKKSVEVTIPDWVEPEKVTVVLGSDVKSVKPNGANVKIIKDENDITHYLNIPTVDASGAIDLTKATVKSEIVKEALDPDKGAEIVLNAESPSLTTSETKPGLTYTLHEGATLQGMNPGDSKVGDGQPWTPSITIKGGTSGFYSIGVTK